MRMRWRPIVCVLLGGCVSSAVAAVPSTAPADAEAAYTAAITKRADDIMAALQMPDTPAADRVRAVLIGRYRELRAWHEANDAPLKAAGWRADFDPWSPAYTKWYYTDTSWERNSIPASRVLSQASIGSAVPDLRLGLPQTQPTTQSDGPPSPAAAIQQIETDRRWRHDRFINFLSADLAPSQVILVKDKMTYDKFRVTYNAYLEIVPNLTDDQKADLRAILIDAREEAMDGGSSEEKSAIFKRYKNRCKVYLIGRGHDVNQDYKNWGEAQKRKNSATTAAGD